MVSLPSWCILKSQANDELVRKRYLFGEGLGKYLDKITNRKSKYSKKGIALMLHLTYKTVVVECSTGIEDLAKAIEEKAEEMLRQGYELVTMSMVGTSQAILVFQI